ncbi:MAG: alkaline phosphatase [Planctomycetota bacterium]|nr:MAG: alkaline phosphatase [Planctomycetota bacterium]
MDTATSRRSLLAAGSLALMPGLVPGLTGSRAAADTLAGRSLTWRGRAAEPAIRLATLTDIHYADADPRGNRYYRDSIPKVAKAIGAINESAVASPLAFTAVLGDLIDSRDTPIEEGGLEQEIGYLKTIESHLATLNTDRHYVFGNHCIHTLTKDEFAEHSAARASFYSFDRPFTRGTGSLHVVVLDACFTSDGTPYGRRNFHWTDANIPDHELRWLKADLEATNSPTIVLTHQRLDGEGNTTIRNAPAAREILQESGKVLGVIQGHHHENSLSVIEGIPYLVMRAVVEGPGVENHAFGLVEVHADHSLLVHGFGTQANHEFARASR